MRSPIGRRIIRPKLSTMPRQENQPTAYLQIYQLAVEKKRLTEELKAIEDRKFNISQRLETIAEKIDLLEKMAHEMDEKKLPAGGGTQPQKTQQSAQFHAEKKSDKTASDPGYSLETMTLDY